MKNKVNLSYVLTTRNKLPYLQETLPLLLNAVRTDEEVVIVDGASTDGTAEYLQALYDKKLINKFISEPDRGEAHALSKAILMASGELIKSITDDDFYYWPNIQKCKEFMLEHPEIDILGTNGASTDWELKNPIKERNLSSEVFEKWVLTGKPFDFRGLGIMLRRSSLPLLGLPHSGLVRVDLEYALRITSIHANLAWFTGYTWVGLESFSSNYNRYYREMVSEGLSVSFLYHVVSSKGYRSKVIPYLFFIVNFPLKILLTILNELFNNIVRKRLYGSRKLGSESLAEDSSSLVMEKIGEWMKLRNQQYPGEFLYKSK